VTPDESCSTTSLDSNSAPLTSLLCFKTARAFLNIKFHHPKHSSLTLDNEIAICHVLTPAGSYAGSLHSHDLFLDLHSRFDDRKEKLEFVAIFEGEEKIGKGGSNMFEMGFVDKYVNAEGIVQFMNVLWTEWINNVAYRRGLGHIVKSVWEENGKDKIQVVLG
jgi:hypothetical protein